MLARALEDGRMPFPWRVGFGVELIQCAALPEIVFVGDKKFAFSQVQRHGVCRISLDLQCMRTGFGGGVDDLQRTGQ